MKNVLLIVATCIVMISCNPSGSKTSLMVETDTIAEVNTLTDAEIANGWTLMFDGKIPGKWRGYNMDHFPASWSVTDGTLHCKASKHDKADVGDRGDIIFDEKLQNFELSLEWKISEGGNSGVFYLAQEIPDKDIWQTAPEMQVLDNVKHPDGQEAIHCAGSLFDIIGVDQNKVKPVGEWNQAKLLVNKGLVEHWLNGEKVVEYHLWTPEWKEMVAGSKFPQFNPDWVNVADEGFIGLQDHGDAVWYRNIRIKKLL